MVTLTDPRAYGRSFSETYDAWYPTVTDANATARFVADRASGGLVLELGVGTGRLAVALRAAGLGVVGLDASPDMLTRCPTDIARLQADMALPPVRSGADVTVLCGFNTVFNLASEQRQQTLFHQMRPLASALILETMELGSRADAAETDTSTSTSTRATTQVGLKEVDDRQVLVTTTTQDHSSQTVVGRHLEITATGVVARPWILRWATTTQLDAMARAAGFDLTERYRSWDGDPWPTEPADTDGEVAISVYR